MCMYNVYSQYWIVNTSNEQEKNTHTQPQSSRSCSRVDNITKVCHSKFIMKMSWKKLELDTQKYAIVRTKNP